MSKRTPLVSYLQPDSESRRRRPEERQALLDVPEVGERNSLSRDTRENMSVIKLHLLSPPTSGHPFLLCVINYISLILVTMAGFLNTLTGCKIACCLCNPHLFCHTFILLSLYNILHCVNQACNFSLGKDQASIQNARHGYHEHQTIGHHFFRRIYH